MNILIHHFQLNNLKLFIFFVKDIFNSFNGNFKVPILKFFILFAALCIPITLFVNKLNIGAPDESDSVLHK